MSDFLKNTINSAAALSLAFVTSVGSAAAQDAGEIREIINGRKVDVKCSTFFPGLPRDRNPAPEKIALVDTAVYHSGHIGPIQFALMSEDERNVHRLTKMHPLNAPLYNATAARYDEATDKNAMLKRLLAESHRDFPEQRWDDMADKCEAIMP